MKELKTNIRNFKKKLSASPSKGLNYQQKQAKRGNIKSSVLRQAEELRSRLEAIYPSFTKPLLKSHVAGCFWMGLPNPFCKMYLPQRETYFTLEDENGNKYGAKYLAAKTAFSGGWRRFSLAKKLSEGDVLVFQLVKPTKFKVYILRKCNVTEKTVTRVIQNLPTEVVRNDQEVGTLEQAIEAQRPSSLSAIAQDKDQEAPSKEHPQILQQEKTSEIERTELNSGKSKHLLFSASVDGNGIASFEEFLIVIDDFLKNKYDLPHNIKCSYYELCCSQGALLHNNNLMKGINPVLVAGSIIETVNVATAIKSCNLQTFNDEFSVWHVKLKSLKILGMKVEFLVSRLEHLQRAASDAEAAKNKQQYLDLCSEHDVSESEIKDVEEKIRELVSVFDKCFDEIEGLKLEIENHESRFQKQVSALTF
ncbi:hypothetical protein SOVF_115280 [Spinacia oleracea]|nr:hypothetical protein SOVF_115280 [Spinacia oleracea]